MQLVEPIKSIFFLMLMNIMQNVKHDVYKKTVYAKLFSS